MNLSNRERNERIESINQFNIDEINIAEIFYKLLRRKKLIGAVSGFVLFLTSLITIYQRIRMPIYRGNFRILIKDPISEDKGFQKNSAAVFALNDPEIDNTTLISFLTSASTLKPITDKYGVMGEIEIKILEVGRRREEAKGILDIYLFHPNLKEGEAIINDLSNLYLNVARKQKQKRLSSGLKFLDSQLPLVREKAIRIEDKLREFRTENNTYNPIEEGRAIKERYEIIRKNIQIIENESKRLRVLKEELKEGKQIKINFTELYGAQTAKISNYNEKDNTSGLPYRPFLALEDAENELAEKKLVYLPNSATIKSLEGRVNKLRPIVIDEVIELNKQRFESLTLKEKATLEKFKFVNKLIQEYNVLILDLNVSQDELGNILTAKYNLRQDMAQKTNPWAIISNPVMKARPVFPSYFKNLVMGTFFGITSGLIAGLLRDRLDNVFHNIEEVKSLTGIPHLAHIPYVELFKDLKENKTSILDSLKEYDPIQEKENSSKEAKYQRFFYQEAFRTLYTSLRFLSTEKKLKTITVTSSVPSEGKSLVNLIFAKTLADVGEKVLLIDCDLRKPTLHTRIGMNNLKGLSNLLIDKKIKFKDIIQDVDGYSNWKIITAGIKPPDPTRLLSSARFQEITEELSTSEDFDIIIFDTPPVAGISDATLVAEKTDGIILLVSLNNVDKNIPRESLLRIRNSKATLLGSITNSTNSKNEVIYSAGYAGYANASTANAYASYIDDDDDENETEEDSPILIKLRKYLFNYFEKLSNWIDN